MMERSQLSLRMLFDAQADFQRHIKAHPEDIDDPQELIDNIIYMKTAMDAELQEMLQEIGWKPWATSRHINYEAAKSELRDAFQFFMNLCFALKMSPEELIGGTFDKLDKNYARADAGYDGIEGKCRWCGRALDDSAVSCENSVDNTSLGWCTKKNEERPGDGFFTLEDLETKQ